MESSSYFSVIGKKGGLIGGPRRAKNLSPAQRSTIARLAIESRWNRYRIANGVAPIALPDYTPVPSKTVQVQQFVHDGHIIQIERDIPALGPERFRQLLIDGTPVDYSWATCRQTPREFAREVASKLPPPREQGGPNAAQNISTIVKKNIPTVTEKAIPAEPRPNFSNR